MFPSVFQSNSPLWSEREREEEGAGEREGEGEYKGSEKGTMNTKNVSSQLQIHAHNTKPHTLMPEVKSTART